MLARSLPARRPVSAVRSLYDIGAGFTPGGKRGILDGPLDDILFETFARQPRFGNMPLLAEYACGGPGRHHQAGQIDARSPRNDRRHSAAGAGTEQRDASGIDALVATGESVYGFGIVGTVEQVGGRVDSAGGAAPREW